MVNEKEIIKATAEGSNTASESKGKKVIRTPELAVEKELLNLKNKVAERGENEIPDFEDFKEKYTTIKATYKNISKTEIIKKDLERVGDIIGNATIPFYGAWTKNRHEKDLEQIIEYYHNNIEIMLEYQENIFKEKNNKIAEMERGIDKLREQYQAESEERKKEKEEERKLKEQAEGREAEIAQLQGETQKALLSAEKKEIEQLKEERNQLRTTTDEQEKFLSRLFKEYERLELEKKDAVYTVLKYDAIIKQRDADIEIINSKLSIESKESSALRVDRARMREEVKQLKEYKTEAQNKIKELKSDKATLEAQATSLEIEKKDWKEKYEKQVQQKRIGLIANVAQGAIEWLPIPQKWQGGLQTSIRVASAWALFKDLPNWTYEGLIMLVGVGLWYFVIYFLRKANRKIFGKKDKKQISNLEKALTNIFEAGVIGKEKKEVSNSPVISKEPVKPEEILTQISNENQAPSIAEKTEIEKPVKKRKNGKKQNKKKIKGDSS